MEITENYLKINKIDTLIVIGAPFIDPQVLYNVQGLIYRIAIRGDDHHHFDVYTRQYAQLFDLNLTHTLSSMYRLRELGYNAEYFLPIFELPIKKKINKKKYDVSFIGGITGKVNRDKYLRYLQKNNIKLYVPAYKSEYLKYSDMLDVYAQSKISLQFNGVTVIKEVEKIYPDIKRISIFMYGRPLEIIASGGFLLTEYAEGIDQIFKDNEHFLSFKSKEDMYNKIVYILNNDKLREEIIDCGQKFLKENLSFKETSTNLMNTIYSSYEKKVDN